jgi:hypothetical protein
LKKSLSNVSYFVPNRVVLLESYGELITSL